MTGEDRADTNGQENVHFEDQLLLDDVIDQDVTVPHREKEESRISWSQIRTTAPDLYAVSLLIFFFGIAVVISVPISVITGTQIPFIPPELLALGSTLMLLIGALIIFFGFRLIRREREAWSMTMLLLVFVLIAGIIQGTITSMTTATVVIALLIYLWLRRGLFTVTTRYSFGPRQTLAFALLAMVIFYGVLGSMYLSDKDGFDPEIGGYTD
ncbi:MAG: hypothetical protein LN414_03585, partial [Candidatus Thermoplasmatota archaeon]|nr:hypothetical protein [Candidatus Thermoplasmatota archaeon]